METIEAIEKILTGNCILFTGSGFGLGSKNILDRNLLLGNTLTDYLYKQCGISVHDNDLKTAAEFYIDEFGEYNLIEFIKNEFTVKEITNEHKLIGSLPWHRVYTTNYDNILELAFSQSNKTLTPITLNENINEYKDFRKFCIHLNGFVDKLSPHTLNQEFKLTNSSYLTTEFINSQWVDLFRSDIYTADVILFIGFSATHDLDISRILSEYSSSTKDKSFFIVSPHESAINIRKLSKFGTPLSIGLSGLCEKIQLVKKDFIPPQRFEYFYKSFIKCAAPSKMLKLRDVDFHNLVYMGDFKWELIYQSVINSDKFPYFVFRDTIETIFEKINVGIFNTVIHSDLGNGKTLFLEGIKAYGIKNGFNVFVFNKYFDLTDSEVEKICSNEGFNLVLIENYSNHFTLIEKFKIHRKNNTYLILTERSIINDTNYYALEEIIGENYYTIDLNRITDIEAKKLSNLLTEYGLWDKYSSKSNEFKFRKIRDDYQSTFRLTLLDILKSPVIRNRLNDLLDSIRTSKPFYEACLLLISSNVFGFNIELEDLVYLLDTELLNNPSFYNNDKLKEIINFNENKIRIKSSILSEGILHSNKYSYDLIPLLVKVTKRLDRSRFNKNHYNLLKSIISHSRLQKLFNTKENHDYRKLVIQFFEEVKNLEYSKKNPFFWLQYAMARLEIRDYKVADSFFNAAYSFADKRDSFDTFQLDNHYARYLLENEIYNGSIETCMEQFTKSHNILSNRTDQNRNRHYPIKVARNYGRFYDHYFDLLNEQDKRIFLISCKEILMRIEDYNKVVPEYSRHRVVNDCFLELSKIIIKEREWIN